jgi:hypothetical protein
LSVGDRDGRPCRVSQARQPGSGLVHRSLADLVVSCESDLFFGPTFARHFSRHFSRYLATAIVGSNARLLACNIATADCHGVQVQWLAPERGTSTMTAWELEVRIVGRRCSSLYTFALFVLGVAVHLWRPNNKISRWGGQRTGQPTHQFMTNVNCNLYCQPNS